MEAKITQIIYSKKSAPASLEVLQNLKILTVISSTKMTMIIKPRKEDFKLKKVLNNS